ncbi:hypothetical protein C9I57_31685 [Trinickia symbiotica]|uniref:Restriction endonuclease type IV Mrr domain-containing protein n=1 Tax=Trinickia symbiotica TaxID=863227 RepID=A0A2T3XJS0_9BURK|nr:restriction endonuclease [Trinickia symbiotica]PTB16775.1 hypothetical protein C9I57_31685 [Trinickia symbiotica]
MDDQTRTIGDQPEDRREISLHDLLSQRSRANVPLLTPLVESLPYETIQWPDFESLCAHILREAPDLKIRQAFRYGVFGQDQDGIDIVATRVDDGKYVVAQCKRWKRITSSSLKKWVREFLQGNRVAGVGKYILCVATILRDTKLLDAWLELENELKVYGIEGELWAADELDQRLRTLPGIVTQFFSPEHAARFCTKRADDMYPARYRSKFESLFDRQLTLENETVCVCFNLPSERFPHFGGIFNFARSDLTGISFSVGGDLLTHWLQWRAYVPSNSDDRPYVTKSWTPGRFVLATHSTRVTLNEEEVEHLDWIFYKAWARFLDAADQLERKWRFRRFERHHGEELGFAIGLIRRRDWTMMLEFASEHDYANGSSAQHIFDRSGAMVKVWLDADRHGLKAGYHVMLWAYPEEGLAAQWESSLTLVWRPLQDLNPEALEFGPDHAWDAEYTHHWVFGTLKPWVEDWARRKHAKIPGRSSWFKPEPRVSRPYECELISLAHLPTYTVGSSQTLEHLTREITYYQSHFHARLGSRIPPAMTASVLKLVRRHLADVGEGDRRYIASNFQLMAECLEEDIERLIREQPEYFCRANGLERAFRCLIQIFREKGEIDLAEHDYVAHQLRPIAERVKEDLLCSVFATR